MKKMAAFDGLRVRHSTHCATPTLVRLLTLRLTIKETDKHQALSF